MSMLEIQLMYRVATTPGNSWKLLELNLTPGKTPGK